MGANVEIGPTLTTVLIMAYMQAINKEIVNTSKGIGQNLYLDDSLDFIQSESRNGFQQVIHNGKIGR